jgi:hypothetical protein
MLFFGHPVQGGTLLLFFQHSSLCLHNTHMCMRMLKIICDVQLLNGMLLVIASLPTPFHTQTHTRLLPYGPPMWLTQTVRGGMLLQSGPNFCSGRNVSSVSTHCTGEAECSLMCSYQLCCCLW